MAEKRPRAARVGVQYEAKSKFYDFTSCPKFWYFQSDPGVKHDSKQCETCIYRSGDQSRQDQLAIKVHCDYLSMTGHRRGCPPSPTCTKYVKGKRLKKRQHFNPHHKSGFKNPDKVKYVKLTKWISR